MDESIDRALFRPVLTYRQVGSLLRPGDFDVFDSSRNRVALVREEGLTSGHAALRPSGRLEALAHRSLVVRDASGTAILNLTKPRSLSRARFLVFDVDRTSIVTFRQRHAVARFAFDLLGSDGSAVGRMDGQGWLSRRRFVVADGNGRRLGEIHMSDRAPREPPALREGGIYSSLIQHEYTAELTSREPRDLVVAAAVGPVGIHLMLNASRF
jgi:hypothetical protein